MDDLQQKIKKKGRMVGPRAMDKNRAAARDTLRAQWSTDSSNGVRFSVGG
ncbi:hypothetical protein ACIPO9_06510 [Pseudomonas sp. NPDC090203]